MCLVLGSVMLLSMCLGVDSSPVNNQQTTDGISWSRGEEDVDCWHQCGEKGGFCPSVCGEIAWSRGEDVDCWHQCGEKGGFCPSVCGEISWSRGEDVDCWHQCGEKGGFCPSVCGEIGWCCRWDFLSDNCPNQARDTSTYGYHSCVQGKSGIEKPSKDGDSVVTNIKSEDEVIGGSPSNIAGSSSEIINLSLTTTCKNPIPPLPSPRWGHTVNYVNNTLIVCGGGYNSSTQTSCIQAASDQNKWEHDSTTSDHLQWEHHSTTHSSGCRTFLPKKVNSNLAHLHNYICDPFIHSLQ